MRYPYLGSENRGILLYPRERLHKMIKDGHERGYQLEVHAIGDLAAEVRPYKLDKMRLIRSRLYLKASKKQAL